MNEIINILAPTMVLTAGGLVVLMLGIFRSERIKLWTGPAALFTIILALFSCTLLRWGDYKAEALSINPMNMALSYMVLMVGLILILVGWSPDKFIRKGDRPISGEFFSMALFSLAGVLMVLAARDVILLFLGLELTSIPTYIMISLSRRRYQAQESALKYFFLGALSAGIMAYGFSFLYGLAGSTRFEVIHQFWTAGVNGIYIIALLMVVIGLCFKIAAVPMHFYAADVYQGAAAPVTAWLAFIPKLAGFYALVLVVGFIGWPLLDTLQTGRTTMYILWIIAALTMTAGNVLALMQHNVKRILAYSSITHSGYIIIALMIGDFPNNVGIRYMMFYIIVYGLATIGAFGVLSLLEHKGDEAQKLTDLGGLSRRHPALAAALAVCIFSLLGMPFTGGFIGKFLVFSSLVNAGPVLVPGNISLLLIALANAAIATVYYLRIVAAAYIDNESSAVRVHAAVPQLVGITIAVLSTILLGIAPGMLLYCLM